MTWGEEEEAGKKGQSGSFLDGRGWIAAGVFAPAAREGNYDRRGGGANAGGWW